VGGIREEMQIEGRRGIVRWWGWATGERVGRTYMSIQHLSSDLQLMHPLQAWRQDVFLTKVESLHPESKLHSPSSHDQ